MAREFTPIEPPPLPGKPGGLGEKVEATAKRAVAWIYNAVVGGIGARIREGIDQLLSEPREFLRGAAAPLLEWVLEIEGLPAPVRSLLREVTGTEPITLTAVLVSIVLAVIMGLVGGIMAPIQRLVSMTVDTALESARAAPGEAFPIEWRFPSLRDKMIRGLKQQGWDEPLIDALRGISIPRLGPADLGTLANREILDWPAFEAEMQARGWEDSSVAGMRELARSYPGPGDLVTFALREVWVPGLREELLTPNASPIYYEKMARQGFDANDAADYWAAHWELPSASMGFEMFQRLPEFTETDLRALLTRLDILPAYQDDIIKISYSPITRVDTRRIYQAGLYDESDVYASYLGVGYSPEDAEKMTAWTVQEYGESERQLTRADILDGLRRGLISGGEALEMLLALNYSQEAAEFYIQREYLKYAEALQKERLAVIEQRFKRGIASEAETREELAGQGLQAAEIEINIEMWAPSRGTQSKRPGLSRLESFYHDGIIAAGELREELAGIGYAEKYIDWYIRALDIEAARGAASEAERAQRDTARAADAQVDRAYQQAAAEIGVSQALARQQAVSAQQALNAAATDIAVLELEDRVSRIGAELAALRLQVAEAREREKKQASALRLLIADDERDRLEGIIATARLDAEAQGVVQAGLAVEAARLQELLVIERDPEQKIELKAEIKALGTSVAESKEIVSRLDVLGAQARQELRSSIPDDTRLRLVREIEQARREAAALALLLAELEEERAGLVAAIEGAMSPEDRAALEAIVAEARNELAALVVEKAELKRGG